MGRNNKSGGLYGSEKPKPDRTVFDFSEPYHPLGLVFLAWHLTEQKEDIEIMRRGSQGFLLVSFFVGESAFQEV